MHKKEISRGDARRMSAQFRGTKPVCENAPVEVSESIKNKPESDIVLHPPNKPVGFKSKASS